MILLYICILIHTHAWPKLSSGSRGTAGRQWRSSLGHKYCLTTEDQDVYITLRRELVSELFVYIGILARLLREVKARLSKLIRFLEDLEEALRNVLAGPQTDTEAQLEVDEID